MFVQSHSRKMNKRRTIAPPRRHIKPRYHRSYRLSIAGRSITSISQNESNQIFEVSIVDDDFDDFADSIEFLLRLANQD